MKADYIEMFPGFSFESIRELCAIGNFLGTFSYYLDHVHFFALVLGTFLGALHVIVLTRKCMRKLSINLCLAGIAIADCSRCIFLVTIFVPNINQRYFNDDSCSLSNSPLVQFTHNISASSAKIAENISVWFGVTIAIIRTLVMRNPLNSKISCLTEAKYGSRIIFIISIAMCLLWIFNYLRLDSATVGGWQPLTNCYNFSEYSTKIVLVNAPGAELLGSTELFRIVRVLEGILLELIPSIILPISTIRLVNDLREAQKSSSNRSAGISNTLRSIKLATCMTISFLFTTTPHGLMYIIGVFTVSTPGLNMILLKILMLFKFLTTLNGIAHILICYFMSSQYRNTTEKLLGYPLFKSKMFVHSS